MKESRVRIEAEKSTEKAFHRIVDMLKDLVGGDEVYHDIQYCGANLVDQGLKIWRIYPPFNLTHYTDSVNLYPIATVSHCRGYGASVVQMQMTPEVAGFLYECREHSGLQGLNLISDSKAKYDLTSIPKLNQSLIMGLLMTLVYRQGTSSSKQFQLASERCKRKMEPNEFIEVKLIITRDHNSDVASSILDDGVSSFSDDQSTDEYTFTFSRKGICCTGGAIGRTRCHEANDYSRTFDKSRVNRLGEDR